MRADEQYPKYPEYRADLPHHYPPPPSFDQRYLVPTHPMKQRSQDFKPTYRPIKTFTVLTSQDPGPGQSWAVGLGPQPRPPLLSDPQPHNQVGKKCYFKTFRFSSTLPMQWLRSPSVREPQLSSTRCCLASLETSSGAHNFTHNIVHKKTERYSQRILEIFS